MWNWQQKNWPVFVFNRQLLTEIETEYLKQSSFLLGSVYHFHPEQQQSLIADLLSQEAVQTSAIEGDYLNRDSVRSSLRQHFGLTTEKCRIPPAELGIASMMSSLYDNYAEPLSHDILYDWHLKLTNHRYDLSCVGRYRDHQDAMQIVSGYEDHYNIHFEAPPSDAVFAEMQGFIDWFNETAPGQKNSLPPVQRACIVHLYFVCIHPFEDGNGRIARALTMKVLSQSLQQPSMSSLSQVIEKNRHLYYTMLEQNNKSLTIDTWLRYFSQTILAAQQDAQLEINFIIKKTQFYDRYEKILNPRQKKIIARLFRAGPSGFKGGLSAKNYMTISQASASTATRDLQQLVEKGILNKTGQQKSTRYQLMLEF